MKFTTLDKADINLIVQHLSHCMSAEQVEGLLMALDIVATKTIAAIPPPSTDTGSGSIPGGTVPA